MKRCGNCSYGGQEANPCRRCFNYSQWVPNGCLRVESEEPWMCDAREAEQGICRHCGNEIHASLKGSWTHYGGLWFCLGEGKAKMAEPVPEGCLMVTMEKSMKINRDNCA